MKLIDLLSLDPEVPNEKAMMYQDGSFAWGALIFRNLLEFQSYLKTHSPKYMIADEPD